MINAPYQELPPAKRRRLIFRTALRSLALTAVLVGSLLRAPAGRAAGCRCRGALLIGFLAFAAMATWQVRSIIIASRYPAVKAIEVLGLILPLYLLLFASTYFVMERASAANFTQPLSRTDALYFAVTVFSTVGFGDIAAKSEPARVVLIFQIAGRPRTPGRRGLRVLLGAVRRGQQRGSDTGGGAGPAAG